MKKFIFSSTLFLLLSTVIYSQWIQQSIGTTNTLLDIEFVDNTKGFVTDDQGNIFKTEDRGENWTKLRNGNGEFLNSITFLEEELMYDAYGYGYALDLYAGTLISIRGDNLQVLNENIGSGLLDIEFINNGDLWGDYHHGWIVGENGNIYKSINNGKSWSLKTSGTTAALSSVDFLNKKVGYAVGIGVILKTEDGGETWEKVYETEDGENTKSFKSVYFVNEAIGWAVGQEWGTGDGLIFHTNDGGKTWEKQNSGITGLRLQSVHFLDNLIGYACGGEGTILATVNGGGNWEIIASNSNSFYRDIFVNNDGNIYAGGINGELIFNSSKIEITTDWGYNKIFEIGSTQRLQWVSENIDEVNIEYSKNNGRTWKIIEENYSAKLGFYDWVIPNTPSIYCKIRLSYKNYSLISRIIPKRDGHSFTILNNENNQWMKIQSPTSQNLVDIKFVDEFNGIAWGSNVLITTTDGGNTWELVNEFESVSASFVDKNNGWIIRRSADTSTVLRTKNSGTTWESIYSVISYDDDFFIGPYLNKISFADTNHGLITSVYSGYSYVGGGASSAVLFTVNGGITWVPNNWYPMDEEPYIGGARINKIKYLEEENYWFESANKWSYDPGVVPDTYNLIYSLKNISGSIEISDWYIPTSVCFLSEGKGGWYNKRFYFEDCESPVPSKYYRMNPNTGKWELLYSVVGKSIKNIYFITNQIGWFAGSLYNCISWNLENKNVICKTTDGGYTWELQHFDGLPNISRFFSLDGQTVWAVGNGGTILRYGNPSIYTPSKWSRDIQINDNNTNQLNLLFGQSTDATNSIDNELGEAELPPPPPAGTFDARFILEDNSSTLLDLRNSDETAIIWTIQFQPSSKGYPITLSWYKDNLPFGSFFLKDAITGSIINVDMKLNDSLVVTNESINKLRIVFKEEFASTITNNNNWDLVSVPLATDNMEVISIFPDATSSAFLFDGSYKSTDNLENGVGYWLKFADSNKTNVYGNEVSSPISVKKGWNIIGAYNNEISTDKIQTEPVGIITSNIYGFENSYFIADKLTPGNGYWIKTNQDGEISFEESSPLDKKSSINKQNSEPTISFDIIAFDGVSDSIKLTFGLDSLATNGFDQFLGEEELPPLPPLGVFDIRLEIPDTLVTSYSDYRPLAVACYEHTIHYQLGDSSDGLTLSWDLPDGVTLNITDLFGGSVFNESFESGEGVFSITNMNINNAQLTLCYSDLIVAQHDKEIIPDAFTLSQNYPNPFNPTTRIQFGLPKESKVSIIIFNILGEKVTELVNQQLKAGYHEVEFNSSNYSSGIYFYRIQAGEFISTKKMLLIK